MGNNVSIPAVPSGLPRGLATFLKAMAESVRILSGEARGAEDSRAVRVSERGSLSTGTTVVGHAAVATEHIKAHSVTTDKLADRAVTGSKLAGGVLPAFFTGEATDGDEITLPGSWDAAPVIMLTSFSLPSAAATDDAPDPATEPVSIGATDLHELPGTEGTWAFKAAGNFTWAAIGYAR